MKNFINILLVFILVIGVVSTVGAIQYFDARSTFLVNDYPNEVVTIDLNDDTFLDLIVSNEYSNDISVLLGNGDGTFNGRLNYSLTTSQYPETVAAADINGDGVPDIITGGLQGIDIFFGLGNGTFSSAYFIDVARVNRLAVDDFNGDLAIDIATTDILSDSVGIHLNNGDSTFTSAYVHVAYASHDIITGKFDVDNYPDIVLGCNNGTIWNLKNDGSGNFTANNFHTDTCSGESYIVAKDFNGNTVKDLAIANKVTDSVTIYLNNGDGTYAVSHNFYAGGDQPVSLVLADVDSDNEDDLLISSYWDVNIKVHLGQGNGFFVFDNWTYFSGSQSQDINVGDFNKDGYIDLTATCVAIDSVAVFLNRMSLILSVDDISPDGLLPDKFSLEQNYPNPFNPETVIRFSLPSASEVKVEVFNLLGQSVKVLVDDYLTAGVKEVRWDGKDKNGSQTSSGVYFYRITTKEFVNTKKMVLLK